MPYIKGKGLREDLDCVFRQFYNILRKGYPLTGSLNYFLFKLAKTTCRKYSDYAAFIGELEAAKLEIYRRLVAPYEDKKIEENGDVE